MVNASYLLIDNFLVAKCVWGSPDMRRCYHYNPNHKTIHVKVHFVLFRNPSFKYCQCTMNMCHIVVSNALSTLYCLLKEVLSHLSRQNISRPTIKTVGTTTGSHDSRDVRQQARLMGRFPPLDTKLSVSTSSDQARVRILLEWTGRCAGYCKIFIISEKERSEQTNREDAAFTVEWGRVRRVLYLSLHSSWRKDTPG